VRRDEGLLLFEDGGVLFVGENSVLELAEGGGFGGRNLDLTDDVFALVMEKIAFGRDRGVVAGKVEIEVDRIWSLIDDVAGRDGDVVAITPAAGAFKVDGIVSESAKWRDSGQAGFEESGDQGNGEADHVEVVSFDAGNPAGGAPLDGVGSGFIHGLAGGDVGGDFFF
jgi:hypothetical protein